MYKEVTVGTNEQGRKAKRVHRIVAECFIPNPLILPEVNHKDLNRENNHVENLEWCTHQDNIEYSRNLGSYDGSKKLGENNPNYHNDTLRLKYLNDPELSNVKNSRPVEKNGRATKILMYSVLCDFKMEFSYIGLCCQYIIDNNICKVRNKDSIRGRIWVSMNKDKVLYGQYKFKYI